MLKDLKKKKTVDRNRKCFQNGIGGERVNVFITVITSGVLKYYFSNLTLNLYAEESGISLAKEVKFRMNCSLGKVTAFQSNQNGGRGFLRRLLIRSLKHITGINFLHVFIYLFFNPN